MDHRGDRNSADCYSGVQFPTWIAGCLDSGGYPETYYASHVMDQSVTSGLMGTEKCNTFTESWRYLSNRLIKKLGQLD